MLKLGLIVASIACVAAIATDDVLSKAKSIESFILDARRELHQIPERGSSEFKTSSAIKRVLDGLGVPYT